MKEAELIHPGYCVWGGVTGLSLVLPTCALLFFDDQLAREPSTVTVAAEGCCVCTLLLLCGCCPWPGEVRRLVFHLPEREMINPCIWKR